MEGKILKKVIDTAYQAGEAALSFYNKDYEVRDKGGDSPLTQADLESNRIILEGLSEYGYGILSEEKEDDLERLNQKRVWIVDPLDGTKDFIHQTGEFAVMIGLVEKKENGYRPILGVVYLPAVDTFYYALEGKGAFKKAGNREEKKIQVSSPEEFNQFRLVGSRFHSSELEEKLFQKLGFREKVPCGSVGVKACTIAEGKAELNINPSDKTWEWDICAPEIILQEAGGILTDLEGKQFSYNKKDPRNQKGYVASNGIKQGEIIRVVNGKR